MVELVVVLAILAMAAAVVSVSIGRGSDKALVRHELSRLQSALKQARRTALMQRVPVEFRLDSEQLTYSILKGGRQEGKTVQMALSVKASADEIIFFPKGNSTGGNVYFKGPGKRNYIIEVDSVTGNPKLKRL